MQMTQLSKIDLEYRYDGSVARIVLNDGKGNVLDKTMMASLSSILSDLENVPDIKLITLEGAGNHFSFGASVEEHTRDKASSMLSGFHRIFTRFVELHVPVVSLISGQCLGGGLELALISNVMFADETAKLGQPEIQLGVFPPPASIILPLKIGQARAEELLLTGRSITAREGLEMGLLQTVFEDKAQMLKGVDVWVEKQILPKSASSLRFAVKAMRSSFNATLVSKLHELEKLYLNDLMNTEDANEGISAFLEKREAIWKNV